VFPAPIPALHAVAVALPHFAGAVVQPSQLSRQPK
jgi:hypothetical protein